VSESIRVTLAPTLAAAAFDHLRQTGEYPWSDPLCTLPTPADKAGTQLRWSASELSKLIDPGGVPVGSRLIDVRSPTEFGICRIEGSLSMYHHALACHTTHRPAADIPFKTLLKDPSLALAGAPDERIVMICRRGNESFLAARALRRFIGEQGATGGEGRVIDVVGGLLAWRGIAEQFPLY
jgi:adenylyltransferase/sulfurtransferase